MNIKVCVADDHTLFRRMLCNLVSGFEGVDNEVKEAANGRELLQVLSKDPIDVVLLDLNMPVMDGQTAARQILWRFPECKLVVVSMDESLSLVVELMKMGIHGFLMKSCCPSEVEKAIYAVYENDFYNSEIMCRAMQWAAHADAQKRPLTERELEVLAKICSELTTKEISAALSISEKTVENHRVNMLKKLGVKNTVGLVKFAFEHGILSQRQG